MDHYGAKCEWFTEEMPGPIGTGPQLAEILHQGLSNLGFLYKWVSSGTMLGLHRDGKFIETDSDIDVAVLGGINQHTMVAAMEPWELIREGTYDGQLQQLAFRTTEDVIFDVQCWYMDGDSLVNYAPHKAIRKIAKVVLPVAMWDSPVGTIPVPHDLDAYCEMRYGSDWRTPAPSKGIYGWENERKQAAAGGSA